jgi:hypothetical protein
MITVDILSWIVVVMCSASPKSIKLTIYGKSGFKTVNLKGTKILQPLPPKEVIVLNSLVEFIPFHFLDRLSISDVAELSSIERPCCDCIAARESASAGFVTCFIGKALAKAALSGLPP